MMCGVYIIFLLNIIIYGLSDPAPDPNPLDVVNINFNLGEEKKGKNYDYSNAAPDPNPMDVVNINFNLREEKKGKNYDYSTSHHRIFQFRKHRNVPKLVKWQRSQPSTAEQITIYNPAGWTQWSQCSKTCGKGFKFRNCIEPGPCEGEKRAECNKDIKCRQSVSDGHRFRAAFTGINSCRRTPSDYLGPFYVKKKYTLETNCISYSNKSKNTGLCDDEEYKMHPIKIQGKVLDLNCKPVKGAIIEYWQAGPEWSETHKNVYTMVDSSCTGWDGKNKPDGKYCVNTMSRKCQESGYDCVLDPYYRAYRGWQKTRDGNYQLHTVPPGIYDIRPIRHIHFKITVPDQIIEGKPFEFITQLYLPQDKPTEGSKLFETYMGDCEYYRIKPEQWAKREELTCPMREEPELEGSNLNNLTIYNWDIVLGMQQ